MLQTPKGSRSAPEICLIEPPFIGNFEGKVFHLENVGHDRVFGLG